MAVINDSVRGFMAKARSFPKLSKEEEGRLALEAQAGNQRSKDRLIEANLKHVVSVALKYRRYGIPVEELISEGNVGLVTAVRKFDPSMGNRFVTYAGYWIRAYVLDCVVRSATLVGGGSGPFRSKIFFRLRRERAQLQQQNMEPHQIRTQLALSFGVSEARMTELLARLDGKDVSLDQPAHEDSMATLVDFLQSEGAAQDEVVAARERGEVLGERIGAALDILDERERLIVEERIMSDEGVSLANLGRKLGISRERARQLEVRAKGKLAVELAEFSPGATLAA